MFNRFLNNNLPVIVFISVTLALIVSDVFIGNINYLTQNPRDYSEIFEALMDLERQVAEHLEEFRLFNG